MKQYLLAVHLAEGEAAPSDAEMQQSHKAVDALNAELQATGTWVFAGGLHPPATATVVRAQGGQVVTTDGPFAETKEPTWTPHSNGPPRGLPPVAGRWRSGHSRSSRRSRSCRARTLPPWSGPTGRARDVR
jgi:hypothetical protein